MSLPFPVLLPLGNNRQISISFGISATPLDRRRSILCLLVSGTSSYDLLKLSDWRECGVRQVALESTGIYWKPVWNILEGQLEVLLVNAQHIKAVPGRKTDQTIVNGSPICCSTDC